MKIILYSNQDVAGKNIVKFLKNLKNGKIFEIDGKIVDLKDLSSEIKEIDIDVIIVASKHKSESGIPTLCVHSPGNFNDAKLGGNEKELSIAPALYIKEAIIEFKKQKELKNLNYDVTLEVTHHGPTLNFPIVFIEVGSKEEQWNDLNACEAAGNVIKALCEKDIKKENVKVCIGIGGGHYGKKFTKILINEKFAFGHIMPKYNFNEEMIEDMILKTVPKPEIALIEWNGLNSEQRNKAIKKLNEINFEWKKV